MEVKAVPPGRGKNQHGASEGDTRIAVPQGTVVYDGNTEALLGDLTEPGQELAVVPGRRGGRGNARFAISTNQAQSLTRQVETLT
jgi:GTP-binding protein